MIESDVFSDGDSECKDFTEEELKMINSYTYDDYQDFSDVKLFDMQNGDRFYKIWDKFGIHPYPGSFCTDFNTNTDRNRLIQRHLCNNNCFWNPRQCFLPSSHSGNLADLMHKDFHDNFNPDFEDQFKRNFSEKIDWGPTGGLGHYPSIGLKKLLDELGITSKLIYDSKKYAINFDNLCRNFKDSMPVRPLFIMEEKKCHDIIEALMNSHHKQIAANRKEMNQQFEESYKGNGPLREPILSLMMWGPQTDYAVKKSDEECKFDTFRSGPHFCTNFSEKHFWMYTHSSSTLCEKGPIDALEGPVMTHEQKVVYPCNRAGCNHACLCYLCTNSKDCPENVHIQHTQDFSSKCPVNGNFYCQEHKIKHPKSFNQDEDISVEKHLFYHNLSLQKNPRKYSTGNIIFAGIKKSCEVCQLNINDHFKYHKIVHLHCAFCVYKMKTADDPKFWDKVCEVCGKILTSIKSLKYWHRRIHDYDWRCEECDILFNRKWNLKRHLIETHGMEFDRSDHDDLDPSDTESKSEEDIDNESSKEEEMESSEENESDFGEIMLNCAKCGTRFTRLENLTRHEETMHGDNKTATKCTICGTNFTRIDNLKEHIKRAHMKEVVKFSCRYCERKFDRKFNQTRHEKKCHLKMELPNK